MLARCPPKQIEQKSKHDQTRSYGNMDYTARYADCLYAWATSSSYYTSNARNVLAVLVSEEPDDLVLITIHFLPISAL